MDFPGRNGHNYDERHRWFDALTCNDVPVGITDWEQEPDIMASSPEKHGRYWRTKWRHRSAGLQYFRHIDKHHVERFLTWLDGEAERDVLQDDPRIEAREYWGGAEAEYDTLTSLARALIRERTMDIESPIKPASVSGYDDRIGRFGELGEVPYDSITVDMVRAHVHRMRTEIRPSTRRPYSPNTVRETVSLMKQVGAWARKSGRADTDPFLDVDLPKGPQVKQQKFLSIELYREFRAFAPSEKFQDMMDLIAMSTGMRIGEVLALRVDDLGREAGYDTLRVDETLTARTGYGPTKNSEVRTLDIDPETAATLRKWSEDRHGRSPIFLNNNETGPVSYNAFSGAWERMILHALKAGLTFPDGPPTTHWLRHTHAAWFLSARNEQGHYVGNIYDLQTRLGHSSIQITIDRYGHLDPQARERAYGAVAAVKRTASSRTGHGRRLRAIG